MATQPMPVQQQQPPSGIVAGGNAANVMSPRAIMKSMKVTPQQQRQLLRIVAAGMKIMFDEKTHHLMLEAIDQPGPIEQRLANGILGLIGILWRESKGSIPPELIIPAAMVLLAEAADFLNKGGMTVTPEQFGTANERLIDMIFNQAGVSSDKIAAAGAGAAQRAPGAMAAAAAAPGAVPQPAGDAA